MTTATANSTCGGGESNIELRADETDKLERSNKKAKGAVVEEPIMDDTMAEPLPSEPSADGTSGVPE